MNKTELRKIAGRMNAPLGRVEKDYVITVILVVLSELEPSNLLAFKGGTAIKKMYFPEARFSEDLDFTCYEDLSIKLQKDLKESIVDVNITDVDFVDVIEEERRGDSVRLSVKYNDVNHHPNSVKIDLSLREKPILKTEKIAIKDEYGVGEELNCAYLALNSFNQLFKKRQYACELLGKTFEAKKGNCFNCEHFTLSSGVQEEDLKKIFIRTLQLDEIFAEKVRSVIARDSPRDVYDIWYLLGKNVKIDLTLVNKKLEKLQVDKKFDIRYFEKRLDKKKKGWERDMSALLPSHPTFEEVKEEIMSSLRNL